MKKLLLLSLSVLFVLTGCDDQTAGKLLEAEKQIVQLQTDFNATQESLMKVETELRQLKPEYEALKKSQAEFPTLRVEIVKLVDKSETLKFEKDPNEEFAPEEGRVSLFASVPQTQVEWLNQLLWKAFMQLSFAEAAPQEVSLTAYKAYLEKEYEKMVNQAKEEKPVGFSLSLSSDYGWARNHILAFSVMIESYTGGAHGTHAIHYLNIDTDKKIQIKLNDLVSPQNQEKFKALLWQSYQTNREETFIERKDFRIVDNFYFTGAGITFVYPLYELGPYVEGQVEVFLSWAEANPYLNPSYQRTAKDGYWADQGEE